MEVSNPSIKKIGIGDNEFELSYITKIYESEDLVMELSAQYLMVLNSTLELKNSEDWKKDWGRM